MTKTNAVRLLEQAGVEYRAVEYEVDETKIGAKHTAEIVGEKSAERVFKTLLFRGVPNGLFVCVVPGEYEVNLKAAAALSGNKSASPVHVKELLPLTGYIRGGCSPIGMTKKYPTYFDENCLLFERIFISGGRRGLVLEVNPEDIIRLTDAEVGNLLD